MKWERFVITSEINGRRLQMTWNTRRPLKIGYPAVVQLQQTKAGIEVKKIGTAEASPALVTITDQMLSPSCDLRLRRKNPATAQDAPVVFNIRRARLVTPVFQRRSGGAQGTKTIELPKTSEHSEEIFAFACMGDWVVESEPIRPGYMRPDYIGYLAGRPVFKLKEKGSKRYVIKAVAHGVDVNVGQDKFHLGRKESKELTESELRKAKVVFEPGSWRFSKVSALRVDDRPEAEENPESIFFKKTLKGLLVASLAFAAVVALVPPSPKKVEEELPPQITKIDYRIPKIVKKEPEKPKPKPQPPKAEPKPEKKLAKAPEPKPKKKPRPAPAPPPALAMKKPTPPPPKTAPPMVAKAPPVQVPPKPMPVVPPPPTPEQIAAQQAAIAAKEAARRAEVARAKLGAALGFVSTTPDTKVKTDYKTNQVYSQLSAADSTIKNAHKNNYLASMANRGIASSNGNIDTRGARNISTTGVVGSPGGKGRHFTKVLGKVALSGGGGGVNFGEPGGGGLKLEGAGKLSQSLVEKTLAKYLERFQYCYEKALLSDSGLAGNVVMSWQIAIGGAASRVNVVRSALNNEQLHNCLSREISRITFPSPQGGSVMVKYPFNFSSSTL